MTASLYLLIPTYLGGKTRDRGENDDGKEFGEPNVPVLIREEEGIRVILGTFLVSCDDCRKSTSLTDQT